MNSEMPKQKDKPGSASKSDATIRPLQELCQDFLNRTCKWEKRRPNANDENDLFIIQNEMEVGVSGHQETGVSYELDDVVSRHQGTGSGDDHSQSGDKFEALDIDKDKCDPEMIAVLQELKQRFEKNMKNKERNAANSLRLKQQQNVREEDVELERVCKPAYTFQLSNLKENLNPNSYNNKQKDTPSEDMDLMKQYKQYKHNFMRCIIKYMYISYGMSAEDVNYLLMILNDPKINHANFWDYENQHLPEELKQYLSGPEVKNGITVLFSNNVTTLSPMDGENLNKIQNKITGLEIQKIEANNLSNQDANVITKLNEELCIQTKKYKQSKEKTELFKNIKDNSRLIVARANNASHNAGDVHGFKIMECLHWLLDIHIRFNIFSSDKFFRGINRGDHFGKRRIVQNPSPENQKKSNKTNNKKDVSLDQTRKSYFIEIYVTTENIYFIYDSNSLSSDKVKTIIKDKYKHLCNSSDDFLNNPIKYSCNLSQIKFSILRIVVFLGLQLNSPTIVILSDNVQIFATIEQRNVQFHNLNDEKKKKKFVLSLFFCCFFVAYVAYVCFLVTDKIVNSIRFFFCRFL